MHPKILCRSVWFSFKSPFRFSLSPLFLSLLLFSSSLHPPSLPFYPSIFLSFLPSLLPSSPSLRPPSFLPPPFPLLLSPFPFLLLPPSLHSSFLPPLSPSSFPSLSSSSSSFHLLLLSPLSPPSLLFRRGPGQEYAKSSLGETIQNLVSFDQSLEIDPLKVQCTHTVFSSILLSPSLSFSPFPVSPCLSLLSLSFHCRSFMR